MRLIILFLLSLIFLSFNVIANPPTLTNALIDDADTTIPNEIDLTPATTRLVTCTSDIYDKSKLTTVTSSATLYQDSYISNSPDDYANHYTNSSCIIGNLNPQRTNGIITCQFNLNFYALPGLWHCNITAVDALDPSSIIANSTINELVAISLNTSNLDFGKLGPNQNTGSLDKTVIINNNGNVQIDIAVNVFGSSLADLNSMSCTTGSLIASDLRYYTSSSIAYLSRTQAISNSGIGSTITTFNLLPQSSGFTSTTKDLYFGMGVDTSDIASGTCSGNIMLTGLIG